MTPRPRAVVTGGARRVGRAIALELARAGCDLVITYRSSRAEAQAVAEEARDLGAQVELVELDLGDPRALDEAAHELAQRHESLDVLVHNASVYEPTPLAGLTAEAVERAYRVNAAAPLVLSARLAEVLGRSRLPHGGAIVAMCDMHAMGRPRKNWSAYLMSKAALAEMVQALARDLGPRVRVNGVAPGVVAWPEHGADADPAFQEAYLKRVPLARAGTPEDAAKAVRWLALEAGYVTGEIVRLDGGRWLA